MPASKPPRRPRPGPAAVGQPPHAPGDAPNDRTTDPRPAMPHERDESAGNTAAQPDPVIRQAAQDLADGQVDTDLRATPGLDAQRRRKSEPG